MNNDKKISIAIANYNNEKYLSKLLDCLIDQTYKNLEIIVVNDKSPGDCDKLMKKYLNNDPRIKYVKHSENKGLFHARLTGADAATGDYITFCDSDDYLPNDALEKLSHIAVESNADIVVGNLMVLSKTGKETIWKNELKYGNTKVDILRSLLRRELGHNLCGKLFNASLLQNYKYDTYEHATNGEDGCLFYQVIANTNKTILINDIVYKYIQNSESSTQKRLTENGIKSICILGIIICLRWLLNMEIRRVFFWCNFFNKCIFAF